MILDAFLQRHAPGDILPWAVQVDAAQRFSLELCQVEAAALELGILPARYQRNRQTVSTADQLRLCRSVTVVIGCGGLGGYAIEELARLGVGRLVLVDPDVFEEHNLNRQLTSTPALLGTSKVHAAAQRVREINPAVSVTPREEAFGPGNGRDILAGADVVVDALDNLLTRVELARLCRDLSIPLVHGAIAGWYGQLAAQLPGEDITPHILGRGGAAKGVETRLGNPSFTPAVVASLQVAEACKILLGKGSPLRGRMLYLNLLDMEFLEIGMKTAGDAQEPTGSG